MTWDYEERFETFQKEQAKMPEIFESPEAISKALIDTDQYQTLAINRDTTKGNLNPNELRQVRADGGLILEIEEAEGLAQMNGCPLDLTITKLKTQGHQGIINTTSRAKHGWISVLAKTDKHINIQQTEQFAEQIGQDFTEQTNQGMLANIKNKLPFRRQEM